MKDFNSGFPPVTRKLAVRHTNFVCLTASFLATGGFVKLFNKFHDFFHDYSVVVFLNSMIFPCMELFLVIFQVFHDFQSLWEPCFIVQNSANIIIFRMQRVDKTPEFHNIAPMHS